MGLSIMPWLALTRPFSNREQSTGDRVSATKLENPTAAAMVRANSVNRRPILPPKNISGTNTAISTRVVAMMAKPTWRAPR